MTSGVGEGNHVVFEEIVLRAFFVLRTVSVLTLLRLCFFWTQFLVMVNDQLAAIRTVKTMLGAIALAFVYFTHLFALFESFSAPDL